MSQQAVDLVLGLEATVVHVAEIHKKIALLEDKQVEAEKALFHRAYVLFADALFTARDLRALEDWATKLGRPGWRDRWVDAGLPTGVALSTLWVDEVKWLPNGPNGTWTNFDPEDGLSPATSRSGSGPVVMWIAYPCATRWTAYEMEDRLLKEHLPYLNKRRAA